MRFSRFLFFIFHAALPLILFLTGCTKHKAPPYNVLLISVDTLRADHLGCYGYERDTTPVIDKLAAEGYLFKNTISTTSWTLPAHMALFTSLYDSVHDVNRDGVKLDPNRITIAEDLKNQGFATAGFYSGPYLHSDFGFSDGFSTYTGCMAYMNLFDRLHSPAAGDEETAARVQIELRSHKDQTSETVRNRAIAWLDKNRNKSFFLFLHFFDAHFDFNPPEPFRSEFRDPAYRGNITSKNFLANPRIHPGMAQEDLNQIISLYDGEIKWVDYNIGLILDKLKESGIYDKTLVVLTSDHGEEFFEHKSKGHRKTLFDEVLKIPLILRFPPKVPQGGKANAQVRIIDVYPTVMDLLGLKPSKEGLGKSLVPFFAGRGERPKLRAFSELVYTREDQTLAFLKCLRTEREKIIADFGKRTFVYFDLLRDPGEHNPMSANESPQAEKMLTDLIELSKTMNLYKKSLPQSSQKREFKLDQKIKHNLIELGYLEKSEDEREEKKSK